MTASPDAQVALAKLLDDVGSYLEYKRDDGSTFVEADPAEVRALSIAQGVAVDAVRSAGSEQHLPARPAPSQPVPSAPAPSPATAKPVPVHVEGEDSLSRIVGEIAHCEACPLSKSRTNTVPGQGADRPDILFVGEGPDHDEEMQGLSSVGHAGQLLTRMIEAMGYTRDQVFITNVVKCRPSDDRNRLPGEMQACLPYLHRQIALLQPKVIVGLGKTAVQGLLGQQDIAITHFRGTWSTFAGIDMMPTYHPAFLLRSPGRKGEAWADLQAVLKRLGKSVPETKKRHA